MLRAIDAPACLRPMTAADMSQVIALQTAFLEGSVVTELGDGFLARFYAAALQHPATIALVAVEDVGLIVGFAVATLDLRAFKRHMNRRVLLYVAVALLPPVRWRLLWSVASGLVDSEPQPYVAAELMLLVVDSRVRRRGIGRQLVQRFEAECRRAGATVYRVTVRSHLTIAREFYGALAFEPERDCVVLGRPMTYLLKRVAN